jgi:hypothetical protein
MALEHRKFSQFNLLKMNQLSLLSATPAIPQRLALDEVGLLPVAEDNVVDVVTQEVAEVNSRELAKAEVANKVDIITMTAVVVVVVAAPEEDDVLAGKTTINLSEIVMPLLISRQIGSYWKKLTSTVSLS